MKKMILVILLLTSGCISSRIYHLDFFYITSCPRCMLFKEDMIPYLEDKYHNLMITLHDIDDQGSLDFYVKTMNLLKDYKADKNSGSIPVIVLDGCFVKIGYSQEEKDLLLINIDKAMNNETITLSADYYLFQDGKTLY